MSDAGTMLGREVEVSGPKRNAGNGTVVGVERTQSTIRDGETGKEWPGVRFKIRTNTGREFWTVTFAITFDKAAQLETRGA